MKEEWLMPGAFVPVDVETTAALVNEVKRLIGVVGSMAINQQRTWVGLTDEEQQELYDAWIKIGDGWGSFYALIEAKLKERIA